VLTIKPRVKEPIAYNVGGMSRSLPVGLLADAFGMERTPNSWGGM
jgi:hypothetical protein